MTSAKGQEQPGEADRLKACFNLGNVTRMAAVQSIFIGKQAGAHSQWTDTYRLLKKSLYMDCTLLNMDFGFVDSKRRHSFTSQPGAKSLQSCPTLGNPTGWCPLGSSVYGILQARILEWVAMPFSRGSWNLLANAGDIRNPGSIPGSGRSPEGGHSYPL